MPGLLWSIHELGITGCELEVKARGTLVLIGWWPRGDGFNCVCMYEWEHQHWQWRNVWKTVTRSSLNHRFHCGRSLRFLKPAWRTAAIASTSWWLRRSLLRVSWSVPFCPNITPPLSSMTGCSASYRYVQVPTVTSQPWGCNYWAFSSLVLVIF